MGRLRASRMCCASCCCRGILHRPLYSRLRLRLRAAPVAWVVAAAQSLCAARPAVPWDSDRPLPVGCGCARLAEAASARQNRERPRDAADPGALESRVPTPPLLPPGRWQAQAIGEPVRPVARAARGEAGKCPEGAARPPSRHQTRWWRLVDEAAEAERACAMARITTPTAAAPTATLPAVGSFLNSSSASSNQLTGYFPCDARSEAASAACSAALCAVVSSRGPNCVS